MEAQLAELINSLRDQRNWVAEINDLAILMKKLNTLNKVTSTREVAKLLNKSKSWIAVSVILAKGLKLYPEIEKFSNRNRAYVYVKRKQKLRGFLES
jgi:hypothetical protein